MILLLPAWAALLVSEEIAGPFVLVLGLSPASGARGAHSGGRREKEALIGSLECVGGVCHLRAWEGGPPGKNLVGLSFGPPRDSSVPAQVSGG